MSEIKRYTPGLNGVSFCGMIECTSGGDWVRYIDHVAEIEKLHMKPFAYFDRTAGTLRFASLQEMADVQNLPDQETPVYLK